MFSCSDKMKYLIDIRQNNMFDFSHISARGKKLNYNIDIFERAFHRFEYNETCDEECDQNLGCWRSEPGYFKECKHSLDTKRKHALNRVTTTHGI